MLEREIITHSKCYDNAPPELYEKLMNFRKEFKIKYFIYEGKTVEYIATEKGSQTLLMFHGALGSADTPWSEILRLKDRFRIIVPTIRDFNTLKFTSKVINEILQKENVEQVFVRGGSFGAYIAQSFFKEHYKKIKKMILVNGIPSKGEYTKKDMRFVRLFKFLLKIIPEKLAKRIILRDLNKLTGNDETELTEDQQNEIYFLKMQVKERMAKIRKRHILESLSLVVEFDLEYQMNSENFEDWKGEILLITDTKDSSYKYFDTLVAQFPNPKIKIFENAGHLLQLLYKNEFEKSNDNFLMSS